MALPPKRKRGEDIVAADTDLDPPPASAASLEIRYPNWRVLPSNRSQFSKIRFRRNKSSPLAVPKTYGRRRVRQPDYASNGQTQFLGSNGL
jgi:hypothetical protein